MTKKEIVEYLERYSDDASLVILIANIKDRLRYGIKEYGFMFNEKIECPVLCIEVNSGEDMDEFMRNACNECESEDHNGEATEMVRTNADRIRSMTDEELYDFLDDITLESQCHICYFKKGWLCEKPFDKSCRDGVMAWLKAEVGCE